jgi:Tfp pilus tip-associated adhesin PilY1
VWKTVLICGQGPGKGSVRAGGRTGNFYFALDITDPSDPQPLWEFTHDYMGETWSIPVMGKIHYEGGTEWACFVGSGYDNSQDYYLGNYFYAVNVADGSLLWEFEAPDVDTSPNFANIPNAFPGSPSIVDRDHEGYVDNVYICDLDGRVWKTDISEDSTFPWTAEAIYTDADNYPIVTKPTVFIDPTVAMAPPRLFFGTGGDDRAPSDVIYSFVALMDNGGEEDPLGEVEWFMGEPADNRLEDQKVGDFSMGDKVWADPVIADFIVYFTTLTGSIESVDPCENLAGVGKLYGRFVISRAGSTVGGTAFSSAGGRMESLDLAIKTRAAVTVGEQERTDSGVRKREVYMQEYDSTIQKLEHTTGGLLKVRSWREIYQVIKK